MLKNNKYNKTVLLLLFTVIFLKLLVLELIDCPSYELQCFLNSKALNKKISFYTHNISKTLHHS